MLPDGAEFGAYRIQRVLGRGGMGIVYLARHVPLDRLVALKTLAPELVAEPQFRERIVNEAKLAASIDHPNILPLYDAGEHAGTWYLAMRYVPGDDLRARIGRDGPLDLRTAAAVVAQVAAALDAAHRAGLLHRDVKPGNILLADAADAGTAHAYLADFGLAKQVAAAAGLTRSGEITGTAAYLAPEQIAGKPVDGRADLYALGCVLFECLTGRPPFERDTEVATLWAHMTEPPPTVRGEVATATDAIDAVLRRALAKDPDERFQTGAELAAAVARLGGTPVELVDAGGRDRRRDAAGDGTRGGRRPVVPARIIAGGIGAVVLALGGALAARSLVPSPTGPAGPTEPTARLAWSVNDDGAGGEIWTVTLQGSAAVDSPRSHGVSGRFPAWHPGGEWLTIASATASNAFTLIDVGAVGSPTRALTVPDFYEVSEPAWSHDGTRLAFVGRPHDDDDLWLHLATVPHPGADAGADLVASGVCRVAAGQADRQTSIAWSPDDTRIAFYDPNDFAEGFLFVAAAHCDPQNLVPVRASNDILAHSLDWTADARSLLVAATEVGRPDAGSVQSLYLVELPGGRTTEALTADPAASTEQVATDGPWWTYVVQRAAVSEIFVHQAGRVTAAVVPDAEGRDYNDPALVTLP